ncbi:MAG: dTMP kinase [Candidatus Pacebacteria bacterium]|nr:dTMP kinase [Candidatus Paceibacterota bacterium]
METSAQLGKFIVLDGIEGCGKGTQTKLLSDFLIKKGYNVITQKHPEYGKPIGDLIDAWLHKKYEFNVETQAMLYFADFIKDKQLLENDIKNGKIIVSDRYFSATIVYQHINGLSIEKLLKLAELFELRKPDLCIYIRISTETSFKRKLEQKGIKLMDRHEADKKFLSALYENYEKMAKENIFCDWAIVDGEQPIENVSKQITEILSQKLNI